MLDIIPVPEIYLQLFLSLALGFLVGLQREWADTALAGVRTFSIVALLGTISAVISDTAGYWFLGLVFFSLLGLAMLKSYQQQRLHPEKEKSLVTEVSLVGVFLVGVLVRLETPMLAAAIACVMAAILHVKIELHAMATRLTKEELRSIMQFLIISVVILPLIPNKTYGPGGAVNLHNIWLMVVLIQGLGLVGYILNKFAGKRVGVLGGGLLGGLISSTATTLSYGRIAVKEEWPNFHALVLLIAWTTLYGRVFLEARVLTSKIDLLWPLVILLVASILVIIFFFRRQKKEKKIFDIKAQPIDFKTAVSFALIYSLILFAVAYFKENAKDEALWIIAFVAGLIDMDAITLSTARLVDRGVLEASVGEGHIFLALFANTLFKGFLPLFLGAKNLFKMILAPWLLMLLGQGIAVLYFIS